MDTKGFLRSYLQYPRGWDSYGGIPLRKDVYDLAIVILSYLDSRGLPEPYVVLGSEGTVAFEWDRDDWELTIEVTSGQSVTVVQQFSSPDDVIEYEVKGGFPFSLAGITDWFIW